jgi:pheromone alpha factor receptor
MAAPANSQIKVQPTFDPFNQTFTLLSPDGASTIQLTISDLDAWYLYNIYCSIEYAVQIGASLILLVVLVLTTNHTKRHSPLFYINVSALLLNFLRLLFSTLVFTGPFSEAYAYLAFDFARVPASAYALSLAGEALTLVLQLVVETSLLLQVHVVCVTLRRGFRVLILSASSAVASLALAFRLYLAVVNGHAILHPQDMSPAEMAELAWLESTSNIVTTITISWFSAVFVTKLGFALRQRRILGLRRWGSMQILFIMGCQTGVIPGMFFLSLSPPLLIILL